MFWKNKIYIKSELYLVFQTVNFISYMGQLPTFLCVNSDSTSGFILALSRAQVAFYEPISYRIIDRACDHWRTVWEIIRPSYRSIFPFDRFLCYRYFCFDLVDFFLSNLVQFFRLCLFSSFDAFKINIYLKFLDPSLKKSA